MATATVGPREVVEFHPNVPVIVGLRYGSPRMVRGQHGERAMYSLADGRVMFVDPPVAAMIDALHVRNGDPIRICYAKRKGEAGMWDVARPRPEERYAGGERRFVPNPDQMPPEPVGELAEQLQESVREVRERILAERAALGERGDGTFAVERAGAGAATPAPVAAAGQQQPGTTCTPNGSTAAWRKHLVDSTNQVVDAYAECLAYASAKHGNTIKPEDVKSLLTTVLINLGKGGAR